MTLLHHSSNNASSNPPPYSANERERSESPIDPQLLVVDHVEGMDDTARRSMEDEERELPEGWIRQYDENSGHAFYVDVRASPPRSIWTHPYDDPEYLRSIPDTDEGRSYNEHADHRTDYTTEHSAETSNHDERLRVPHISEEEARERARVEHEKEENPSLGSRIKNKLTGTTKSERDEKKRVKAEQERAHQKALQEQFLKRRAALRQAHAERMNDPEFQRYYASTGSRYSAPVYPYGRSPYVGGGIYGRRGYRGGLGYGGYGAPLMMGGLGGLGGGLLLGSAMGGGFGGMGMGGMGGGMGGGGGGGGGGC